jgi:hypothetical protein
MPGDSAADGEARISTAGSQVKPLPGLILALSNRYGVFQRGVFSETVSQSGQTIEQLSLEN